MAHDENLAQSVPERLNGVDGISEKATFGGLAFVLHGNTAVGVFERRELTVRGAQRDLTALARPHRRLFDVRPADKGLDPRRPGRGCSRRSR
jgi:hypothetical protein